MTTVGAIRFRRRGLPRSLTLLEMLVVIVLLGLAAGLGMTSWSGAGDEARVQAAVVTLEQMLRRAAQESRTRHRPTTVLLDCGAARVRIQHRSDQAGAWHELTGVSLRALSGISPQRSDGAELLAVRLTPAGVHLPLELEFRGGGFRQRVRFEWGRAHVLNGTQRSEAK